MMWKHFSLQRNKKWLSVLPKVVMQYNSTVHNTIGYKPKDVGAKNEREIMKNVYARRNRKIFATTPPSRLAVGENVRISKHREIFTRGYTPNWSNEIFTIVKVQNTNPVTYLLKDLDGEEIRGGFYAAELQRVKHPDVYMVDKILRRKGNKVYVKFSGIDEKGWILKKNIV